MIERLQYVQFGLAFRKKRVITRGDNAPHLKREVHGAELGWRVDIDARRLSSA